MIGDDNINSKNNKEIADCLLGKKFFDNFSTADILIPASKTAIERREKR